MKPILLLICIALVTGCAARFSTPLTEMSSEELCHDYASSNQPRKKNRNLLELLFDSRPPHKQERADLLMGEIENRNLLDDIEMSLAAEKKIALGMSSLAVRCSWGRPHKINRTLTSSSSREQWVWYSSFYRSPDRIKGIVYIDRGQVSAVQN